MMVLVVVDDSIKGAVVENVDREGGAGQQQLSRRDERRRAVAKMFGLFSEWE